MVLNKAGVMSAAAGFACLDDNGPPVLEGAPLSDD